MRTFKYLGLALIFLVTFITFFSGAINQNIFHSTMIFIIIILLWIIFRLRKSHKYLYKRQNEELSQISQNYVKLKKSNDHLISNYRKYMFPILPELLETKEYLENLKAPINVINNTEYALYAFAEMAALSCGNDNERKDTLISWINSLENKIYNYPENNLKNVLKFI